MARDPMDDKYVQQFKKHLEQVDAFTLVVLKSHLIVNRHGIRTRIASRRMLPDE
jgi:hypothetical protein